MQQVWGSALQRSSAIIYGESSSIVVLFFLPCFSFPFFTPLIRTVLDAELQAPPVDSFVSLAESPSETFSESVKDALAQCSSKSWASEIEKAPSKSRNGRPRVIVVSGAAMRCVQLINELRTAMAGAEKKEGDAGGKSVPVIAKLWSKHMKLEEQKGECSFSFLRLTQQLFPFRVLVVTLLRDCCRDSCSSWKTRCRQSSFVKESTTYCLGLCAK